MDINSFVSIFTNFFSVEQPTYLQVQLVHVLLFNIFRSENNVDILSRNVKVIAEGVARHLFEVSCEVVC